MKKLLITGATGFLGGYLIKECLDLGYEIVAFGRNEKIGRSLESDHVTFVKGDLADQTELEEAFKLGLNMVVHAGALSTVWGSWQSFYDSNVLGTQNVVDLCEDYGIEKLIFVSSPSIYAQPSDQLLVTEEEAPKVNKLSYYIESKLMGEAIVKKAKLPYVICRPRGLFGVGDTSIIPRLISLNERMGIPLVRDGQQEIDVTCVENVAYAIGLMLEKDLANGQTYNITNGEPMTFKAILSAFFEEMGKPVHFKKLPVSLLKVLATSCEASYKFFKIDKEPVLTCYTYNLLRYSQTLSIEKAKCELGYQPRIAVREGIKHYVQNQVH